MLIGAADDFIVSFVLDGYMLQTLAAHATTKGPHVAVLSPALDPAYLFAKPEPRQLAYVVLLRRPDLDAISTAFADSPVASPQRPISALLLLCSCALFAPPPDGSTPPLLGRWAR
jgi:hypothetical protein